MANTGMVRRFYRATQIVLVAVGVISFVAYLQIMKNYSDNQLYKLKTFERNIEFSYGSSEFYLSTEEARPIVILHYAAIGCVVLLAFNAFVAGDVSWEKSNRKVDKDHP